MKATIREMTTDKDHAAAKKCLECPICKHARAKQKGVAYWFVKSVEGKFCPNCKSFEKVYGRKAYEPMPPK